jgi:hypothetical protein
MANRGSKRQTKSASFARSAANDDALSVGPAGPDMPQSGSPANDNPSINDLPTCLEITDEEVRLLQRYLGRQILDLFG